MHSTLIVTSSTSMMFGKDNRPVWDAILYTSKSSLKLGADSSAVFALSDALLAPLAPRHEAQARQTGLQAAQNDSLLSVAKECSGPHSSRVSPTHRSNFPKLPLVDRRGG